MTGISAHDDKTQSPTDVKRIKLMFVASANRRLADCFDIGLLIQSGKMRLGAESLGN